MTDEDEENTYVPLDDVKHYIRSLNVLEELAEKERTLADDLGVAVVPPKGDKLLTLGEQLERYDDIIDRAEAALKSTKARRRVLGEQTIPDVMRNRGLIKNNGTGNFGLPSGNKVSLRNSTKPGIKKDDLSVAFEWFRDAKLLDVVYMSVSGKMKVSDAALLAAVKTLRKAGRTVPTFIGLFEIVRAVIINPRKAKGEQEDE